MWIFNANPFHVFPEALKTWDFPQTYIQKSWDIGIISPVLLVNGLSKITQARPRYFESITTDNHLERLLEQKKMQLETFYTVHM